MGLLKEELRRAGSLILQSADATRVPAGGALAVDRESAKWFTLSGVLVFLSQMFLYMAMSVAPVTVVSPINRLSIKAAVPSISTCTVQ